MCIRVVIRRLHPCLTLSSACVARALPGSAACFGSGGRGAKRGGGGLGPELGPGLGPITLGDDIGLMTYAKASIRIQRADLYRKYLSRYQVWSKLMQKNQKDAYLLRVESCLLHFAAYTLLAVVMLRHLKILPV